MPSTFGVYRLLATERMQDIVGKRERVSRVPEKTGYQRQDQLSRKREVRCASVESEIFRVTCRLLGSFDRLAVELHRAAKCAA